MKKLKLLDIISIISSILVILGAMLKIMHYPFAIWILFVGILGHLVFGTAWLLRLIKGKMNI